MFFPLSKGDGDDLAVRLDPDHTLPAAKEQTALNILTQIPRKHHIYGEPPTVRSGAPPPPAGLVDRGPETTS